ncbi:MAG: 50S ribosomal protein L10 [Planctomycetota bacterium]
MPNRINALMYKELTARFKDSNVMIMLTNTGLSGEDACTVRRQFRDQNFTLSNVKNSVAALVLEKECGVKNADAAFNGPTWVVAGDEPATVAKAALAVVKKMTGIEVCGAVVEKVVLPASAIKTLSTMPTRRELIGMVSGQATAPFRRVIAQAIAPHARLASQIKTVSEKE